MVALEEEGMGQIIMGGNSREDQGSCPYLFDTEAAPVSVISQLQHRNKSSLGINYVCDTITQTSKYLQM